MTDIETARTVVGAIGKSSKFNQTYKLCQSTKQNVANQWILFFGYVKETWSPSACSPLQCKIHNILYVLLLSNDVKLMHAINNVCIYVQLCRPTMVKICKMKSVSEFKPDPYVATVLNCMMWTFYGLPFVQPDSLLVITIHGAGLVMELVYVVIFFIFATSPVRVSI